MRNALRLIEGQWVHSVNFYGLDPEDVMLGASAAIFCESDSKNFEASNAFTVKHSLFEDDDGAADPPFIIFNTRVWNRLSERQLAVLTVHELVHFLVGDCDDEVRHDVDCHIQLCMLPPPTHVGWRHAEYRPRLRAISRRAERGGEND